MEKDDRGITLVELIIAITISVIIVGAATLFFMTAQKSYQRAEETVHLQEETQILMEQLASWIMEGNGVKVETDATYGQVLVIYKIPRKTTTALPAGMTLEDASKRVIWRHGDRLYMKTASGITDPMVDTTVIDASDIKDEYCISEYISGFTVTLDRTGQASVLVNLKMTDGGRDYELDNEVMLRNEWLLSMEGGNLYEETA